MATKDELEKENAELKEKIGGLERELEDALESATAGGGDEALAARVKELEAQLEDAAANGGDEALAEENAMLKSELSKVKGENEQLQAALDGSNAKDGGKDARGEELPDWKKPEYSGGLTGEQAEWRHKHIIQK